MSSNYKFKNLRYYKPITTTMVTGALLIGSLAGTALYYNVETTKQVQPADTQQTPVFTTENGKTHGYFDVGEHVIKVSRNDAYTYKPNEIEGYIIKEVEVNSWRHNNQITYVNTVPVVVPATQSKNGEYEFNTFGTVETTKTEEKGKSK